MKKLFYFCVAMVLAIQCSAFATLMDINPPSFRTSPPGQATTTMQGWSFSTNANPAIADVVNNSFGIPTLSVSSGIWMSSFAGASGVWRFISSGSIDMYIPNAGNNAPDTWKEVNLQIIYKDPAGSGDEVPLITNPGYESSERITHQSVGTQGYWLDTYKIIIRPNPPGEELLAFTIQCALYVDEIVVDTICIPEPATMSLLGLGGLLLRKRRS
jgi:hypothetical protein